MKVKIFRASGHDDIGALQHTINEWIESAEAKVQDTQTTMCQVADSPQGERFQYHDGLARL